MTKNLSPLLKSDVWQKFGFPSKICADGQNHDVIPGFVSCFECFKTFTYDGSTKYMKKHTCSVGHSAGRAAPISNQGTMDKYLAKKAVIGKTSQRSPSMGRVRTQK